MKQKFYLSGIGIIMAMSGMLSGCSNDNDVDLPRTFEERKDIELTPQTRATAEELQDFYIRFTTDMVRFSDGQDGSSSQNIVVSPLSVAMLFGMTANGVGSETAQAYADYLGVSDLNSLNSLCSTLLRELPGVDSSAVLRLANAIWVNKGMGFRLTDSFSSIMKENYGAELRYDDFLKDNDRTKDDINGWCSKKTDNLINGFLDNLSSDSYAILLNALYFNGLWKEDLFDEARTKTDTFHGTEKDSQIEMMESLYTESDFSENDDFIYFSLPFGNEAYRMRFVIPKESTGMVEPKLSADLYDSLLHKSKDTLIKVFLPKFSVDNSHTLNDMLAATASTDLTEDIEITMFSGDVTGSILYNHATSFSIDETGAESAAVASGEVLDTVVVGKDEIGRVTVKVDSPFYFFITESSTGACILSGRIANL